MTPQASHRLIYSAGTQVVTAKDVMAQNDRIAHPAGAVGVIVQAPIDRTHAYRVKFADGFEAAIHHDQLTRLADYCHHWSFTLLRNTMSSSRLHQAALRNIMLITIWVSPQLSGSYLPRSLRLASSHCFMFIEFC